jgi:hypothetical protein
MRTKKSLANHILRERGAFLQGRDPYRLRRLSRYPHCQSGEIAELSNDEARHIGSVQHRRVPASGAAGAQP